MDSILGSGSDVREVISLSNTTTATCNQLLYSHQLYRSSHQSSSQHKTKCNIATTIASKSLFLPLPVPRNHRSSHLMQRRRRHTLLFSFILLLLLRSQHSGTQRLAFGVLKFNLLTKCHRLLPLPRGPPPPCTCPRCCRCASSIPPVLIFGLSN